VIASRVRRELVIERSRFVTTLDRADSVAAARAAVAAISAELGPATHHCFAFLIGAPASTAMVGMSDDGEPHGTAGRPMLDVLVGSGVGDVVVVVSRWFGGVKLGKGGLVRAYGNCVLDALAAAPRAEKVDWLTVTLRFDYDQLRVVDHLHPRFEVEVEASEFSESITQRVRLPAERFAAAAAAWRDATRGRIAIEP
jgi:uncharacterized YigZ family protein